MIFTVVPHDMQYVVERLGRYHRTLSAGAHFLAPLLDQIAFRFSTRPADQEIEDRCITVDNVPIEIVSILRWRIADARKAAYEVADVREFASALARAQQRQWIAGRRWEDVRESTRELEAAVVRNASDDAAHAGIELEELTVRSIDRVTS